MDRQERLNELNAALLVALEGLQADIWTSVQGIVQSFDPATETCAIQPATRCQYTSPTDGTKKWITLPLLVDCPVFFQSGGGCTLTFPIKAGDEAIVVFANRSIDTWWQQGGVQNPDRIRMHDLSDGFVFVGPRSLPNVLSPNVSTAEAQLRSNDGQAVITINPTTHKVRVQTSGDIDAIASGNIKLDGARIDLNGVLYINGEAYTIHRHSGVQTGGGNTGGKVP